jgi:hypothetical protein
MGTPAANRAKIGGLVTYSNDPTVAVGSFGWFQVFDNGHGHTGAPDRSSLVGFGDEAANEAFCASPNLPRFGPWDVQGEIKVNTQVPPGGGPSRAASAATPGESVEPDRRQEQRSHGDLLVERVELEQ